MKKIFIILPLLLLLTGCGKIKIENYTLHITKSNTCDFKTLYENEDLLVSGYCVDEVKLKTTENEEIGITELLQNNIIDIKDTLDGQIKESVEEDGTIVLNGREARYKILICDESYSEKEKIVILPMKQYHDFMCLY